MQGNPIGDLQIPTRLSTGCPWAQRSGQPVGRQINNVWKTIEEAVMGFTPVGNTFFGNLSAVHDTVQVSESRYKQVVSVFARLGPDSGGHQALGHRSLSLIDGEISWNGGDWESLGGDFRSNPVAVQSLGGVPSSLDPAYRVFLRGLDNRLWVKWSNGTSWFGPEPVGGEFQSEISAVDSPRGIHVFVRGLDEGPARGQLWAFFYGPSSTPDTPRMDLAQLGGSFEGNPVAISDYSRGHIHVFVRGLDNRLWRNWFDGTTWRGFSSLGGPTFAGDPVPVLVRGASGGATPGGIFVFVLTTEGTGLAYRRLNEDGTATSAWSPLNPGELARTVGSAPVGVNRAVGTIDLFTRGAGSTSSSGSGTLWHTGQTLSPVAEAPFNDWEDMRQGPFLGTPCAVAAAGSIQVFVGGLDNRLWHMWWNGRSWS